MMDIPRWLDYADATESNWREARQFPNVCEYARCLQSHRVLPLVSCRRTCHPGHGHTAACDALSAIEERLHELASQDEHEGHRSPTLVDFHGTFGWPHRDAEGHLNPQVKLQRALLMLDMWRGQADGVRDPALEDELGREYEAIAARVPQSDRLNP